MISLQKMESCGGAVHKLHWEVRALKKLPVDKIGKIAGSVAFFAAVALLGMAFVDTDTAWYAGLARSALQPEGLVFGVVWTALYAMLAAAFAITLLSAGKYARAADVLFLLAGALNALWCYLFFGQQAPAPALICLCAIVAEAVALNACAAKANRWAGWLTAPYLLWVAFATALNYEIVLLN